MIKPVDDKVVIEPVVETERVSASGFIVSTNNEKPQEAIVVAVGSGVVTRNGVQVPIPLSVGQKVIFSKYSGNEIVHDGKSYNIISYNDIMAVID
jgi:chaperonin GroES